MCLYFGKYNIDIYGHRLFFICVRRGKNMTITITRMCLSTPTRVFFSNRRLFFVTHIYIYTRHRGVGKRVQWPFLKFDTRILGHRRPRSLVFTHNNILCSF